MYYAATNYHLFITTLVIYFCRVYNKRQMVIGVPVFNRSGKRYKSTLGMCAVLMPLKVALEIDDTVDSLLP